MTILDHGFICPVTAQGVRPGQRESTFRVEGIVGYGLQYFLQYGACMWVFEIKVNE